MIQTEEPRPKTTVYPPEELTYQEWVDKLRIEQNVVVSSKFLAKSIEKRIQVDEAIMMGLENQVTQEESKPSILLGIKNFLNQF